MRFALISLFAGEWELTGLLQVAAFEPLLMPDDRGLVVDVLFEFRLHSHRVYEAGVK